MHDLVDVPGHIYTIGRIDVDSESVVFLTNDIELIHRLSHPRFMHKKKYRFLVASRPDEKQLTARNGVVLGGGCHTQTVKVRVTGICGRGAGMQVIFTEGRKCHISESCPLTCLSVVHTIRVRVGRMQLGSH